MTQYDFGWAGFNGAKNAEHLDLALQNKVFDYLSSGLPTIAFRHRTIQRFVEKHGIGLIVKDIEELPELLRNVDIFVMPSIREEFGVAAVEAQAMEIPVVSTRVGGVPEVVLDGETGILVEPGDSEQLAQAILTLIENPALRRQMGKRGREHVLANYRWEDNAALMENLYQRIVHSSEK